MSHRSTRAIGALAAPFLLVSAAAGGCGHSMFNFASDEASAESGSGGGLPPVVGSGGVSGLGSGGGQQVGSGGFPPFVGSGGFSGGGEGGGEGGGPPCAGPGCPERPCCGDLDPRCGPFDGCGYCSHPDQCPLGFSCDPLTDQCLLGCDDDFDCPEFCDRSRGVCVQCFEHVHCRDKRSCELGFCIACDNRC